jgi:hypothetical protein
MSVILDSGKRQEFGTGSVRDTNDGKGDFSLLPYYSISELAIHFQKGAAKYSAENWRKGQPLSRYFDSAQRHLSKFAMGFDDENHLIASIWNLMCLLETRRMVELKQLPEKLNDFPRINLEEKTINVK